MRLENGMRFDRCIGLQDRDALDGKIFSANVLDCHEKPLTIGESIRVGDRAYRYEGDDNLGNSIFTALEPFPQFETVEQSYKELFIVLEIYPMKNEHFYVRPYVQSGETGDDYTRRGFPFAGEFESRDAAVRAGFEAGRKEINTHYFLSEADHDQEQQTHSPLGGAGIPVAGRCGGYPDEFLVEFQSRQSGVGNRSRDARRYGRCRRVFESLQGGCRRCSPRPDREGVSWPSSQEGG